MYKKLILILNLFFFYNNDKNVIEAKTFFQSKEQLNEIEFDYEYDYVFDENGPLTSSSKTTLKYENKKPQEYFATHLQSKTLIPTVENTCGIVKPKISLLVSKGKKTDHQLWPWNVQLILNSEIPKIQQLKGARKSINDDDGDGDQKVFCGGTIISQDLLLTAAHCFDELITKKNYLALDSDFDELLELTAKNTLIIFNAIENENPSNIYIKKKKNPIKIYAEEIIIHPNYIKNNAVLDELSIYSDDINEFQQRLNYYINNRQQLETGPRNDIALIRFRLPTIKKQIPLMPVCLPPPYPQATKTNAYDDIFINCKVLGQGFMNEYDEENFIISKDLQSADITISPNEVCKSKFESHDIREKINSDTLCIIGPMHPCLGDSGGPLVCQNKNTRTWHLVGITSFAVSTNKDDRCGQFKSAVFAKVANYLDWIYDQF